MRKKYLFIPLLIISFLAGFTCFSPGKIDQTIKVGKPKGWVSDFAGAMGSSEKRSMLDVIREAGYKTGCEIVVVTVNSTGDRSIEEYASDLFNSWKIGKRDQDNGVLLIASMMDRRVRIEVGYGLESVITDGKAGEILDKYVMPNFQIGEYAKGMMLGTFAIAETIAASRGIKLETKMAGAVQIDEEGAGPVAPKPGIAQMVFGFIIFVFILILFIRHPFLFLLFWGLGGRSGGSGSRGGFGGGFGGFGGGTSGGGGASRGW